jgi:hypothetical protein
MVAVNHVSGGMPGQLACECVNLNDACFNAGDCQVEPKCDATGGDELAWVTKWMVAEETQSCTVACEAVKGKCNDEEMASLTATAKGKKLAKRAFEAAGAECTSYNGWDYGHGHSQCTHELCCGGDCVNACSIVDMRDCDAPGDNDHHSRLCACDQLVGGDPDTNLDDDIFDRFGINLDDIDAMFNDGDFARETIYFGMRGVRAREI